MDSRTRSRQVVNDCLAYRARRLARSMTRIYNEALRPHGLSIAEMNLLVAIGSHGSAQPVDLARGMDMDKSTLSRNLRRLVRRGWVEAAENPDGRGDLVGLTEAGAGVLEAAMPAWMEAQRQAVGLLGDQAIPVLSDVA